MAQVSQPMRSLAMTSPFQESRTQVIRRIAREAMLARQLNVQHFAEAFVEQAHALTPVAFAATKLRLPHPTDAYQHEKDCANNRQIVDRWIKGVVQQFPAELEEPWVLALPPTHRAAALRELSARYGLIPAHAPDASDLRSDAGDLMAIMGMVLKRFAPIAQDGVINHLDRPHLKPFLSSLAEAQAVLASLHAQAAAGLADEPAPTPNKVSAIRSAS